MNAQIIKTNNLFARRPHSTFSMGRNLQTFTWFLICISQIYAVDATYEYINVSCVEENGNYTKGSAYQLNLNILLSDLSSQGSTRAFYNSTTGEVPNKIYGLYQCRGDVTQEVCAECIQDASQKIVLGCPLVAEAAVWYYECMLRYANHSIFSVSETYPGYATWYTRNVSNYEEFAPILATTLESVINDAAKISSMGHFATKAVNLTLFEMIYCLAQCTPDLDGFDCKNCLTTSRSTMTNSYNASVGVAIFKASCQLRYSTLKQFYRDTSSNPPLPSNAPSPSNTTVPGMSLTLSLLYYTTHPSRFIPVSFVCMKIQTPNH